MKFGALAGMLGMIVGVIGIAPAVAETVPMDPDGFTQYAADGLRQRLPGYRVSVAGPLTIKIAPKSGDALQANLDRMYEFCKHNEDACAEMLRDYEAKLAGSVKNLDAPPDPTRLRVVVRPVGYANEIRQQLGAHAQEFIVENLSDELVVLCYFDFPTSMRTATTTDFSKMHMTNEQAFARARQNVAAELGSLDSAIKQLPEHGIGQLSGNAYESSWLALHDAWGGVAQRFGGKLIVAVPAADVLLYAESNDAVSIDALHTAAVEFAGHSDRPISASVYRWTVDGWERLAP